MGNKHKTSQERTGKKTQEKHSPSSILSPRLQGPMTETLPSVYGRRCWYDAENLPSHIQKSMPPVGLVSRIQTVNFPGVTQDKFHHEFNRDQLWVTEWPGIVPKSSEVHQLLECVQFSWNKRTWFMCIHLVLFPQLLFPVLFVSGVSMSLYGHVWSNKQCGSVNYETQVSLVHVLTTITVAVHFQSLCYDSGILQYFHTSIHCFLTMLLWGIFFSQFYWWGNQGTKKLQKLPKSSCQ